MGNKVELDSPIRNDYLKNLLVFVTITLGTDLHMIFSQLSSSAGGHVLCCMKKGKLQKFPDRLDGMKLRIKHYYNEPLPIQRVISKII